MKTVRYVSNPFTGENYGIEVKSDTSTSLVPLDPANTDYQQIMALVQDGELTIAPAEEAE